MQVLMRREGAVAVLTLHHPPVNCLSQPMRQSLWEALEAADAADEARAIVLTGAGRGFCAGGDLREMKSPLQQAWPGISRHLLPRIEDCRKPVIAAMHGFAIGGGLELALACHYRVAQRDTRIALPEMKHGVIPPSGSQRMPRAVGTERALQLMVNGDTVTADSFADTALFDGLCDGDALAAAIAWAQHVDPAVPAAQALLRHRPLDEAEAHAGIARWRGLLRAMPKASVAMHRCVDAVAFALHAPTFDAGLVAAKQLHDQLAADLLQETTR